MGHLGGEVVEQDDAVLVGRFREGDPESFNLLARRWKRRIFNFVYRYTGSVENAEDLTQETLTKAFKNLIRLEDPARFSSWIYKIALNECRMDRRRDRSYRHVSLDSPAENADGEPTRLEIPDMTESVEVLAQRREIMDRLKEVFGTLPVEQRVVIIMKEYEDLKFHEIAEILNVPLSTVKSRLYKGLQSLKKLLESA